MRFKGREKEAIACMFWKAVLGVRGSQGKKMARTVSPNRGKAFGGSRELWEEEQRPQFFIKWDMRDGK